MKKNKNDSDDCVYHWHRSNPNDLAVITKTETGYMISIYNVDSKVIASFKLNKINMFLNR